MINATASAPIFDQTETALQRVLGALPNARALA
jgi:hypothetical protein